MWRIKTKFSLVVAGVLGVVMIAAIACGSSEPAAAPAAPAAPKAAAPAAKAAPAAPAAAAAAPAAPKAPAAPAAASAGDSAAAAASAAPAKAAADAKAAAQATAAKKAAERTSATTRTTAAAGGTVKGSYAAKKLDPGMPAILGGVITTQPASWQENPRFTAATAAGTPWDIANGDHYGNHSGPLPALDARAPVAADRMIMDVPDEIGDYGGIWRLSLSGWMLDMAQYSYAKCTKMQTDNIGTFNNVCKDWQASDDGRTFTFTLREGMKYGDGSNLDIESVKFAAEGINHNPEKNPRGQAWMKDLITGETAKFAVVDDKSFTYTFDNANYSFGENGTRGQYCRGWCLYASEKHKELVPGYADAAKLDAMIKEIDLEDWVSHFKTRLSVHTRHSRMYPALGPYAQQEGTSTGAGLKSESNPYYHGFDPMGNQLPYHDGFQAFGYESREVAVFRAMAGENDALTVSFVVEELPLYQQNMEKGDFSIYQWAALGGQDLGWTFNQTFNADPEIGRLMRQKDFRIAWSVAQDREAVNETVMLGIGTPQEGVVHKSTLYYPGDKYATENATYEPDRAKTLLAGLGLTDTDGDGYVNYKGDLGGNTGNVEFFVEVSVGGHAQDRYLTPVRLLQEQLGKVGIKLDWKASERSHVKLRANEAYLGFGGGWGGANAFVSMTGFLPLTSGSHIGPLISEYYTSNGESGMGPTGPDAAYLPTAPSNTFAADSNGEILKGITTFLEARKYPKNHPDRISNAKAFYAHKATEKYNNGLIGFTGNQWGTVIKRNNFRNVPKHHTAATIGFRHEVYFFEDGKDNLNNSGNKSKKYSSESFLTGLTYD